MSFHTSSASAICGIALGCRKLTASMRLTPVCDNASISSTLAAVGTGASFCKPSRGPTSRRLIAAGRSLMTTRLVLRATLELVRAPQPGRVEQRVAPHRPFRRRAQSPAVLTLEQAGVLAIVEYF